MGASCASRFEWLRLASLPVANLQSKLGMTHALLRTRCHIDPLTLETFDDHRHGGDDLGPARVPNVNQVVSQILSEKLPAEAAPLLPLVIPRAHRSLPDRSNGGRTTGYPTTTRSRTRTYREPRGSVPGRRDRQPDDLPYGERPKNLDAEPMRHLAPSSSCR